MNFILLFLSGIFFASLPAFFLFASEVFVFTFSVVWDKVSSQSVLKNSPVRILSKVSPRVFVAGVGSMCIS